MTDYIFTVKDEEQISVGLNLQHDALFIIGEKINQINEMAYMSGYNWEAFFEYYLSKYAPDVLEGTLTQKPEHILHTTI